jgi:hypothetical protein
MTMREMTRTGLALLLAAATAAGGGCFTVTSRYQSEVPVVTDVRVAGDVLHVDECRLDYEVEIRETVVLLEVHQHAPRRRAHLVSCRSLSAPLLPAGCAAPLARWRAAADELRAAERAGAREVDPDPERQRCLERRREILRRIQETTSAAERGRLARDVPDCPRVEPEATPRREAAPAPPTVTAEVLAQLWSEIPPACRELAEGASAPGAQEGTP